MESFKRLSPQEWIDAGLRALSEIGPSALKADVLAKTLGVSRGSFYWHFVNVDAFHQAVLSSWETGAVDLPYFSAGGTQGSSAAEVLRKLILAAMSASIEQEVAVHAWAMQSAAARDAVARVNARRVSILAELFEARGCAQTAANARARVLCLAFLGRAQLSPSGRELQVANELIEAFVDQ